MPRPFVMPGEQPNAFASGRDPAHAAVAVTEGLLTGLPCEHVRRVFAHASGSVLTAGQKRRSVERSCSRIAQRRASIHASPSMIMLDRRASSGSSGPGRSRSRS